MGKPVARKAGRAPGGAKNVATSGPTNGAEGDGGRIDRWLAAMRARAALPDAPREGWVEVRTVNGFGDVVSRQVPERLHSDIVASPTWRPGASLHASAAFASEHLADAADANPDAAEELVPLAWLAGLVARAALRFERGTLTDEDRAAVREAALLLRRDMAPRREGVGPNYDGHEPPVGPWQTLPKFSRRDRVREQLAQAKRFLPRDPERPRALQQYAQALASQVGPRRSRSLPLEADPAIPRLREQWKRAKSPLEADLRKLWERGKLDPEAALVAAYVHLEGMTLDSARDFVRGSRR